MEHQQNLTSLCGWTLRIGIPVCFLLLLLLLMLAWSALYSWTAKKIIAFFFLPKVRSLWLTFSAPKSIRGGPTRYYSTHTSQKHSCVQCKPNFTGVPTYSECTSIDGTKQIA
jgi:hypothetical protein